MVGRLDFSIGMTWPGAGKSANSFPRGTQPAMPATVFYERSLDCIDILQAKIDALLFEQALATEPAVPFDDE